jgi:hypothetical protein
MYLYVSVANAEPHHSLTKLAFVSRLRVTPHVHDYSSQHMCKYLWKTLKIKATVLFDPICGVHNVDLNIYQTHIEKYTAGNTMVIRGIQQINLTTTRLGHDINPLI